MALVLGFQVPALDNFRGTFIQRFAFQIIINVVISDAKGRFIRQGRAIVFQIRGWRFLVQMLRAAQRGEQLLALTFVETENRVDVGADICLEGFLGQGRHRRIW